MVKPLTFTATDHVRIADAIREAEGATSGEIFAVFARRSDSYVVVSSVMVLALSLVAALLTAIVGEIMDFGFSALAVTGMQALGTIALILVLRLSMRLRLLFVPRSAQAEQCHRLALAQFMAHNIHATEARTGILLFVSEAEHHAEIVADAGINAKVPQAEWDAIVDRLTAAARDDRLADGLVEAALAAGRLLAAHFPAEARNPNEILDRMVEI